MDKTIFFILGAIAGSVITYKITENKFKNIADEEIESVKEKFKEKENELLNSKKEEKKDYNAYKEILQTYKQENENKQKDNEELKEDAKVKVKDDDKPDVKIISPEEFGNLENYEESCWVLYSDNIITDEFNNIVKDPKLFLGDCLDCLEDNDESIFIRNNDTYTDYEIIRIDDTYNDEEE